MKSGWRIFSGTQCGGMLAELLLSVAIMAVIVPFVFRYQHNAAVRTKNIAVMRRMENIQSALERYIVENRDTLMRTVGRTITRIEMSQIMPYGLNENLIDDASRYQMRILKSSDATGQATLQGVIVYESDDISPLRTREIVNMGGETMGFIEDNIAFGAFGAWHVDAVDMGLGGASGIIETTNTSRGNPRYMWRVPSDVSDDATMLTGLSLGGHDITNTAFFDASVARFSETLDAPVVAVGNLVFQTRANVNQDYFTSVANVNGTMSADSRNLEIANTLSLADVAKVSSFSADTLWVSNLSLASVNIATEDDDTAAVLKINQSLDMTRGRITAMFASVGFAGSITPRIEILERLEDSINPNYYWDAASGTGRFADLSLGELNDLAAYAVSIESGGATAAKIFRTVASNPNATAGDFINAINKIGESVRGKYRRLNLE